jgi:hypothetical protein
MHPNTNEGSVMLRLVVSVAAVVVLVMAIASAAAAAPPDRVELPPFTFSAPLTGVCPFTVTVTSSLTGSLTTFYDRDGNITREVIDNAERDVFTANGKTLEGLPYTFKLTFIYDPPTGELLHAYATGVASRVRLPDGSLFITAGRLDFLNHPGEDFVLQPDHGAQGNIAGFCAALSP